MFPKTKSTVLRAGFPEYHVWFCVILLAEPLSVLMVGPGRSEGKLQAAGEEGSVEFEGGGRTDSRRLQHTVC